PRHLRCQRVRRHVPRPGRARDHLVGRGTVRSVAALSSAPASSSYMWLVSAFLLRCAIERDGHHALALSGDDVLGHGWCLLREVSAPPEHRGSPPRACEVHYFACEIFSMRSRRTACPSPPRRGRSADTCGSRQALSRSRPPSCCTRPPRCPSASTAGSPSS